MQAKSVRGPQSRAKLLEGLDRAMRHSSGLGVVFSQAVAGRLGINPSDLECLDIIATHDGVTPGELAQATGLTTGAITGLIDRLERAGFARRERDREDRRKIRVRLTPDALAKAAPFYGSLEKAMKRVLVDYSDAEIALLLGFFSRARDVMLAEIEKLNEKPR